MDEHTSNPKLSEMNNIHDHIDPRLRTQVEENWAGVSLCVVAAATAAAATAVATNINSKHFAADKLGEIAYKVLVLARSEREVEKGLDVDCFHDQLHNSEEKSVRGNPCAMGWEGRCRFRSDEGGHVREPKFCLYSH